MVDSGVQSETPTEPGVYLHGYTGDPLADDDLRKQFALARNDFLIVTATVAQARSRVDLAPPRQQRPDHADGRRQGPAIVFHDVIRHLMAEPVLSRFEQRVALQ